MKISRKTKKWKYNFSTVSISYHLSMDENTGSNQKRFKTMIGTRSISIEYLPQETQDLIVDLIFNSEKVVQED